MSNISILGDRFREQLEGEGIGATNDKSDVGQKLISKGLNSNSSYKMSREIVQQAMAGNKDLQYFLICIVIVPEKNVTTKQLEINHMQKLAFVVGKGNKNYEKLTISDSFT